VATRAGFVGALALAAGCLGACGGSGDSTAPPATEPAPVAAVAPATDPPPTTAVPDDAGRAAFVYAPAVGDCFDARTQVDDRSGRQTMYRLVVDCALPHEQEVFAVVDHPAPPGAPFPGDEALRRFARLECPRPFAAYVGRPYELSRYGLGLVLPGADQWAGTRAVGCTLTSGAGARTSGSARGAGS
jgi:hypothetical protein